MELSDRTLAEVIDLLAAREPAPGGGSAAALAGALSAGLTEMSAAFALTASRSTDDAAPARDFDCARVAGGDAASAGGPDGKVTDHQVRLIEVRDRAHELRGELLSLAEDDTRSYAPVLDALAMQRSDPERARCLRTALAAAAEIPLAIAVAAAEVGELACVAAQAGNEYLLGDASVAAVIAEGAARSAARLVELNLASRPDDARIARAEAAAQRAGAARRAVLGPDRSQRSSARYEG
jgi:methenyltetrahydrofolate cyclohydrolase